KRGGGPFLPERRLGPFKVFRGKLTLDVEPEPLPRQPEMILKLFRVADEQGLPLYSWAKEQVVQALPVLCQARAAPEVVQEMKGLLQRRGTHGQFLFEMDARGAPGALVARFRRRTAVHQQELH